MNRTDDFKEEVAKTSYKDYSRQISDYKNRQRIKTIVRGIPQNTTMDPDAQDKGLESGYNQKEQITIQPQEFFKQWRGRVIEIVDNDNFIARIEQLGGKIKEQKIVRFNRKKVTIANKDLFEEGAVFYWTVGIFQNERKMMVKRSEIRFQMLNAPSPYLIKEMEEEIGKVFDGISWLV